MNETKLAQKISWIVAAVLVFLPFHALFTTWLGSNFGRLDAWRIWKELVIVVLAVLAIWLAWTDKYIRKWLKTNWLPRLILIYTLLYIGTGIWALAVGNVNSSALIYSLLSNLRFLGFFMIALTAATKSEFLKRNWRKLLAIPAVIVVGFGLLQRFVLPYDFLQHFGYGPKTIPAYQTVDNKIDYRRIQSTLRGANPLGAYLVLAIPALFLALKKQKSVRWLVLGLSLIAIFYSYSRSAWLGLAVTTALLIYWSLHSQKLKQATILGVVIATLVIGGGVLVLRSSHVVQNTVFHTDTTSGSPDSSNEDRLAALEEGAQDVLHEPLGRGPGTAGPASFRNNHSPRIAENYFLQIGQEVGWLGIALFVAINFMVAKMLWQQKSDVLARLLLAALVGLNVVNMLSHAWADDTLGLMYFGLAGIALSPAILETKRTKHETS
jgi:hypothetical protein